MKAVNVDEVLKILYRYSEYIFVTDYPKYREMQDKIANLPKVTNNADAVLDKIRDEIDIARFIDKDTKLCKNVNASGLEVAMQIIDKYKVESEG